jgi:diguanylate cyclase (GGDEF)-like protein
MSCATEPSRRRVLLIDSDSAQASHIHAMLEAFRGERFELDCASGYNSGLQDLLSGRYCSCILNSQLDRSSGLELLKRATLSRCPTPVLFLTKAEDEAMESEALKEGALDAMGKGELSPRILERSLRYLLTLRAIQEALGNRATHDEVTGLLNRREMERILGEEWQRALRFGRIFSISLVDLDHFKLVNDTHGHPVGDAVLRHVSSLLSGQVRSVDRVARYGGEEFAIIQIETDHAGAMNATERLRALLEDMPCVLTERQLTITVTLSAGVASYPEHGKTIEELVEAADRALYEAKRLGRNRIVGALKAGLRDESGIPS